MVIEKQDDQTPDLDALTEAALSAAPERKGGKAARAWYTLALAEGDVVADLNVYDAIGAWSDGITAKQFVADLQALPESVSEIRLHVNSPGGDVFDAIAIANALRSHRARVVTTIEGLAASAATIVTQGGSDEVLVADNAIVMVHNPYGWAMGSAKDMRDMADALDRSRDAIVATYRRKSALSPKKLEALMDATTWMGADEALENGFADSKVKVARAAASIDPRALAQLEVPEQYAARVAELVRRPVAELVVEVKVEGAEEAAKQITAAAASVLPAPAERVISLCREAGITDLEYAGRLVDLKTTEEDARQLVSAERERRAAEAARRQEIAAACKMAGAEELTEGYVEGGMPVAAVKAHLVVVTAKVDAARAGIDTSLGMGSGGARPVIDVAAVYAARNARR